MWDFDCHEFNITPLSKYSNKEEIIIIDFHPEPFRCNNSLLEESISNTLPSIVLCVSLNLKSSRSRKRTREIVVGQVRSKSFIIKSKNKWLSDSLAYGENIKLTQYAFMFGSKITF